jgi:integrase
MRELSVVEQRYRAVLEVQAGVSVSEVALRYGVSRQSVHTWLARYGAEGLDGLRDRSHRPAGNPKKLPGEVEAAICELRRAHRRWGPRRLAYEMGRRGRPVARSTVYRVLVRNGLIEPKARRRRRQDYIRWERDTAMQLWQMDVTASVFLVDGTELKIVTGIDDHSRFCVSAKEHAGLSDNSVRIIHATLRAALENAVREERLSRNVARLVRRSRPKAASVAPLDVGEARRLLDAARHDRLYALWAVAIGVGLRRGEALGLRWQDVDLEAGTVRVVQSLQRVDAALRMAAPKTSRSRRTVFLPEVCRAALRDHLSRQDEERRAAGIAWQESGLVFTTTIGTPIDPRNVKRWLDALSDRAGMRRIRIHDLRHTCASVLLAQGVHPRVVMETLGHSQMAVTMDIYSHVMPAVQEEAAREMQKALGPVAVNAAVNRGRPGADGVGAGA